ncbi:PilN domain-containing protein [Moorena sp. SIO3I6]|uniref:PilN domain-containing protein n=1 Tax=Moorena sp. SIO3I6 TaxID=2607831 RepID=UPI0013F979E8|nr:PilN domain-containing protein [Moorena sp. SIO3I6]NEP26558.1 fimbrial assembly protein [Moorena sp. SIO3I6]
MYSLDINFLKDRNPEEIKSVQEVGGRQGMALGEMTPLLIGAAVGLILPGLVGGFWVVLQHQNARLKEEIADVDKKLAALGAQKQRISKLNKELKLVNDETNALASVFNQIKPWSAMLQDIRERTPPGVQIKDIEQQQVTDKNASKDESSANSRPKIELDISGTARTFDDVNYFLLTLQNSSFFDKNDTQLLKAQLVNNPTKLEIPESQKELVTQVKYTLPKVVEYTIKTKLSDIPASELLKELDRKGAVGLVTRIRNLQSQGVIQQ